ncbi:CBS domain-containing protein, partial [Dyella sp.]|uniref:CBS domain-containing protein n=1 Tax=Dyella sp. TaxID=1869338 RepID=UPI003F7D5C96
SVATVRPTARSGGPGALLAVVAALGMAGIVAVVAGLLLTGAAAASLVADPGAVTRWGLPLARVVNDVAASLTIGLLVLAAVALPVTGATGRPARSSAARPQVDGVTAWAVRVAAATGVVWAVAGVVVLVLSYARLAGVAPSDPAFASQLGSFVTTIDLLRSLLVNVLVVAVVATGADPDKLTLGQIMSRPVVTCTESEGLFAAILTMREHGVRRLPVLNAKGGLAGMISADDIYGALGAQMVDLGEALTREETREMQERP